MPRHSVSAKPSEAEPVRSHLSITHRRISLRCSRAPDWAPRSYRSALPVQQSCTRPLLCNCSTRRARRLPMAVKLNRKIHHRDTETRRRRRCTSAPNLSVEFLFLRFSVPLCLCASVPLCLCGESYRACLVGPARPRLINQIMPGAHHRGEQLRCCRASRLTTLKRGRCSDSFKK
jgi:hypothetical protein